MSQKSSNILFAKEQKELCLLLIQLYGSKFSEQDRVIFEMVLSGGCSTNEIANQFELSGPSVRQICEKTFRRLKSYITTSVKKDASSKVLEEESRKLKEENEEFKINAALSKHGKTNLNNQGFKTPLTELGFNTRLIKSLATYNINTIADLKQLKFMDIIRLPKVGRKSIAQFENILAKYSITLN